MPEEVVCCVCGLAFPKPEWLAVDFTFSHHGTNNVHSAQAATPEAGMYIRRDIYEKRIADIRAHRVEELVELTVNYERELARSERTEALLKAAQATTREVTETLELERKKSDQQLRSLGQQRVNMDEAMVILEATSSEHLVEAAKRAMARITSLTNDCHIYKADCHRAVERADKAEHEAKAEREGNLKIRELLKFKPEETMFAGAERVAREMAAQEACGTYAELEAKLDEVRRTPKTHEHSWSPTETHGAYRCECGRIKRHAMEKKDFDPDLSPDHETNKQAARDRGLRYDARKRAYVDQDGCLVRDRFGQRL